MNEPICSVCNIPMILGSSISGKRWFCKNYWKCGQSEKIKIKNKN